MLGKLGVGWFLSILDGFFLLECFLGEFFSVYVNCTGICNRLGFFCGGRLKIKMK